LLEDTHDTLYNLAQVADGFLQFKQCSHKNPQQQEPKTHLHLTLHLIIISKHTTNYQHHHGTHQAG
jgi:hypothetical protein